ncbi:hypothetical protein OBBRIDRAFT_802871 [Obba rivulosa]|uniref:Uncharacterized protein n=1 Tax=Obba rivulosa TaxID=1052685 RepID=A0A8E2DNY2_9APHY|nr:hypothetical protein OBBRIDRAFT_802871 [Obba rivulosa]
MQVKLTAETRFVSLQEFDAGFAGVLPRTAEETRSTCLFGEIVKAAVTTECLSRVETRKHPSTPRIDLVLFVNGMRSEQDAYGGLSAFCPHTAAFQICQGYPNGLEGAVYGDIAHGRSLSSRHHSRIGSQANTNGGCPCALCRSPLEATAPHACLPLTSNQRGVPWSRAACGPRCECSCRANLGNGGNPQLKQQIQTAKFKNNVGRLRDRGVSALRVAWTAAEQISPLRDIQFMDTDTLHRCINQEDLFRSGLMVLLHSPYDEAHMYLLGTGTASTVYDDFVCLVASIGNVTRQSGRDAPLVYAPPIYSAGILRSRGSRDVTMPGRTAHTSNVPGGIMERGVRHRIVGGILQFYWCLGMSVTNERKLTVPPAVLSSTLNNGYIGDRTYGGMWWSA